MSAQTTWFVNASPKVRAEISAMAWGWTGYAQWSAEATCRRLTGQTSPWPHPSTGQRQPQSAEPSTANGPRVTDAHLPEAGHIPESTSIPITPETST